MLIAAAAGPAHAAWTTPTTLGPSGATDRGATEPGPRAAFGTDGSVLATWVRSARSETTVDAAIGDDRGHFAAAQRLGKGLRPAVAVGWDGAALVVFEGTGGLRIAVRRPGAERFAAPRVVVPQPTNGAEDTFPLVGVLPGGDALLVYEHDLRVKGRYTTGLRAVQLDLATGRRQGATQRLGDLSLPRGATLEHGPGGALFLLTSINLPTPYGYTAGPPVVLGWGAGSAPSTRFSPTAPGGFAEGVLTGDGSTRLALSGVDAVLRGDAGSSGRPIAMSLQDDPLAAPSPFAGPRIPLPRRTFGAVAAPVAGGAVGLVWQQKTRPEGFSREAPVMATTISATGRPGTTVRLSARKGSEPQIAALEGGAITVWDDAGRLAAARRTSRGWARIAPPRGAVVRFHDYVTNRQLVTAGTSAVFIWEAERSIRLSVLRG
ncbi:MAG: hypothetical protein JWM93_1840 [Frankiales bacterium]|nr:hypothetical protein [Frankiales bacterium]